MPSVRRFDQCAAPVLLVILLVGGTMPAVAQPAADSSTADTTARGLRLEAMLDTVTPSDQTAERAAEQFARLNAHPLNLNQASAADLSVLPGLTAATAHRIVQHRVREGPFERVSALRSVAGVTAETVQTVRPFLTVDAEDEARFFPAFDTILSNLDFSLIQRYTRELERGRGYREDRFLGPPGRITSRLRLDYERRLQLALTVDKDPGEPLRWAPATDTYGFDHVVGSLTVRDVGPIDTFILGDFTAQFGQGVALWQGIRFGKGRNPVSPVLNQGRGVLPYRSASEANFFRGSALSVDLPAGLSLTGFVSRRNRDASLDSSLVTGNGPIPVRTISVGGQHRTPSELSRKGTFGETTVGGALEYRSSLLHLGATGYYARFNRPLRPGDKPYRRFRASGRHTSALSVYGTAYLNDYTLFGEVARSPNGTYGGLVGGALDLEDRVQAILLGRRYPARLASFYGNAFGERGRPQNEMGVYTGLRLRVAEDWTVAAYFDQFRSPWLRFNVPRPTTGWEARVVLQHNPRPWLSTYLQARAQREEESTDHRGPGDRLLEGIQPERRQSIRGHVEYAFSDALTLRTRLELTRHSTPETTARGFLLTQGLRWTPLPSLQLDARFAVFDTDGFAARIYAYEHDLLYSFSVPVFFDEGRRSYVLAQYEPIPSLTLEAKYGITSYAHRSTIGSGLNRIQGTSRREIRVQLRWSL